jgi:hypothetical protein
VQPHPVFATRVSLKREKNYKSFFEVHRGRGPHHRPFIHKFRDFLSAGEPLPPSPPSRVRSVTVKEKRVFKKFFRVSWRSEDGSPAGLRPSTPPPAPLSTSPETSWAQVSPSASSQVTGQVGHRQKEKRISKTFQRSMEVRGRVTSGLRPAPGPPGEPLPHMSPASRVRSSAT